MTDEMSSTHEYQQWFFSIVFGCDTKLPQWMSTLVFDTGKCQLAVSLNISFRRLVDVTSCLDENVNDVQLFGLDSQV